MEFKENEKLSYQLTSYITKYADGEEIKKVSQNLNIDISATNNLLYRKIKFKREYTDLIINLVEISVKKGILYSSKTTKLKKLIKLWKKK